MMPKKPAEKSFKEIVDLLEEYQVPKPKKIAKQFKSKMINKKEGALLSKYLAELHHLTEHCDYKN